MHIGRISHLLMLYAILSNVHLLWSIPEVVQEVTLIFSIVAVREDANFLCMASHFLEACSVPTYLER